MSVAAWVTTAGWPGLTAWTARHLDVAPILSAMAIAAATAVTALVLGGTGGAVLRLCRRGSAGRRSTHG